MHSKKSILISLLLCSLAFCQTRHSQSEQFYVSITDPPFNAIPNDAVDDSTAIQAAIDVNEPFILIPDGIFLCNVSVDGWVNIKGVGPNSILKTNSANPVITVTERLDRPIPSGSSPLGRRFENFTIWGDALTSKGIYYSAATVEEEIVNVYFNGCTRAIDFGTFGAIANNVRYCSFRGCNYDVYAKDSGDGAIALNLNYFTQNISMANKLCCIYLNGSAVGLDGNEFNGNWFEDCDGFGIILKDTDVQGHPNRLSGGWWEGIGDDASTVTLDDEGAGQTVRTIWMDTTKLTASEFPGNALVNDSVLDVGWFRGEGGAGTYNEMTITGVSRVEIETAMFDDTGGADMIADDTSSLVISKPRNYRESSTGRGFIVEGLPMVNNVTDYGNDCTVEQQGIYSGSVITDQPGSLFGSRIRRFELSDDTEWLYSPVVVNDGKVYALTFSIKSSTAAAEEDIAIRIAGTGTLLSQRSLIARGDRWTHYVAILPAGPTAPTGQTLRIFPTTGNAATFDITRLQFVECDTLAEAEAFVHNQHYAGEDSYAIVAEIVSYENEAVFYEGEAVTY